MDVVDYEYIRSCGVHGVHAHDQFDALAGSQREIWIGSDGSGVIRETTGPMSFFTEEGETRWDAAGRPNLCHGPSIDVHAPGCLWGSRVRRARLVAQFDGLEAAFTALGPLTLSTVQSWLGDAVVEPKFCRALYEIAARLPGVEVVGLLTDQRGRAGRGLVGAEGIHRTELIFSSDTSQLLSYQQFLTEDVPFAPAGALHSWTAYLEREVIAELPPEFPPLPTYPCVPPGSGRAFVIRSGFIVSTGYVEDPLPRLAQLRADGVLTDAEYESAKTNAAGL